jgi:hypothetical protein
MNTQPAATTASATRKLALSRVVSTRIGNSSASSNIFDCGKLKPCGSRHGSCTRYESSSAAT